MTTLRVGFVGLGAMGRPMAENTLRAGHDLMVHDLRQAPEQELAAMGARVGSSGREVGAHGDVIQIAVPDDAQVEAAVLGEDGVLAGARPGAVIAIHSTIHPNTARRIGERAAQSGVHVLDAQMTGGQHGALDRALTFMVGGSAEALERARPVLAASGSDIFHMGGLGTGATTKVAQQAITCINLMAAVEGFRLAERAQINMEAFQQVLASSTAQSYVISQRMGLDRAEGEGRDPRPFYRGLRAVLSLAFDLDVPVPATALAQQTIPWALGSRGDNS